MRRSPRWRASSLRTQMASFGTLGVGPAYLCRLWDVKALMVPRCGPGRGGGGAWACCGIGVGPRTPRLTLALDAGWFPVGYMMWWGVPADGLRPLGLTRPFPLGWGRQQGFGNWPRFIGDWWACRVTVGLGADRLHRLVTETAQHVIAAFEQLARDRDARAVAAESLGELFVIGPVGATRAPRRLRGFVQRPAQGRWSLPRQSARRRGADLIGRR